MHDYDRMTSSEIVEDLAILFVRLVEAIEKLPQEHCERADRLSSACHGFCRAVRNTDLAEDAYEDLLEQLGWFCPDEVE